MSDNSDLPIPEVADSGWDWFEQQGKKEIQQETGMDEQEIVVHFQKCFGTKSGKIVLAYLEKLSIDTPDFDPEMGFYNGASFGFFRSGQKQVFREIRSLVNTDLKQLKQSKGK